MEEKKLWCERRVEKTDNRPRLRCGPVFRKCGRKAVAKDEYGNLFCKKCSEEAWFPLEPIT